MNSVMFNTTFFNAEGNIILLDLTESMTESDSQFYVVDKLLVDIVTPADVLVTTPHKALFESVFFSDGIALLLFAHKVFPETIRMTSWLTIQRDRRNSEPSQWTGA